MTFARRGRPGVYGGPSPLSYRSAAGTVNAGTITKPSGVAVGDLVVIITGFGSDPVITTGATAWTKVSTATQRLFWKILDASDVGSAWNSTDPGTYAIAAAYSNLGQSIGSVTARSAANAGPNVTALTAAGFAPSASGKPRAVIAAIMSSAAGNAPAVSSTFTSRLAGTNPAGAIADRLLGYSGEAAAWSGLTSNGSSVYSGWLLEVQ